ncbi:MAG: FtsX-like permease family protein [Bacteroidota bacterium]
MSVSLFVARRFLLSRRNRGFISFITFFAVLGVTLGVASLIVTLSILRGFETTIKENVVGFTSHMQIFGFQSQPLMNPESSMRRVSEKFPGVKAMAPYVAREGMIRSDAGIDGVLIKGIDPHNDVSSVRKHIVAGVYDLAVRDSGIQQVTIGKRLAERLQVGIGDEVLLFALGGSSLDLSQARIMRFIVSGIYETGMEEYDASYVYIHLRSAQLLFQYGSAVSGFDILVYDVATLPDLVQEIPSVLGYPHYGRTMFQMYRNLFSWIDLQKKQVPIILALIIVVATVNVIGTLLMMVLEKTKEIAVLRTLGATRSTVSRIFLLQGTLIGFLGTALGTILGYGLCWLETTYRLISLPSGIYYMSHVPIEHHWSDAAVVCGSALMLCYLCSLIPSRLAGKRDPVELLRFAV